MRLNLLLEVSLERIYLNLSYVKRAVLCQNCALIDRFLTISTRHNHLILVGFSSRWPQMGSPKNLGFQLTFGGGLGGFLSCLGLFGGGQSVGLSTALEPNLVRNNL